MKKGDLYTSLLRKLSSQKEQKIASLSFLNEIIYYTARAEDADIFMRKIVEIVSKYIGLSALYLLDKKSKSLIVKHSLIKDLEETIQLKNYDELADIITEEGSSGLSIKQMELSDRLKDCIILPKRLSVLPLYAKTSNEALGIMLINAELDFVETANLQTLYVAILLISNFLSCVKLIKNNIAVNRKIIKLILKMMFFDDLPTYRHSLRVQRYAVEMAKMLAFSKESIKRLRLSAVLHDVGKITIPYDVLYKEESLSEEEFNAIKQHTQVGYILLRDFDFAKQSLEDILNHHEKLDGSGYPNSIKEIDIITQVLAVADIIDAMSSTRAYKDDMGFVYITDEIKRLKGKYDDRVIKTAVDFINSNKFLLLKKRFKVLESKEDKTAVSMGSLREKIHQLKSENQNLSKQVSLYKELLNKSQKTIEQITQKSVNTESEKYKAVVKLLFDSIKPVSVVFVEIIKETLHITRVKGEPVNLENSVQLLSNKKLLQAVLSKKVYVSRKIIVFPLFDKQAVCVFLSPQSKSDEQTVNKIKQSLENIVK